MVKQEIKSFYMDCLGHSGLECTAPCSLYSVLLEHKIIDDPARTENPDSFAKYSAKGCTFTAKFEVTPLVLSMKNVLLRFSGLDTLCHVELNGQEVANTDNMHVTYNFEVKTKLHVGINELKLVFSAPKESASLRKAYFSFGRYGAPRLVDMGIFRKVEIVAFNHKIISDVSVKQTHRDGSVRLDLAVKTYGHDDSSRAVATLTSPAGNVYFCGLTGGVGNMTITDPNLWWPNGLGMQNLYKLHVNLYSEIEIEDTYEMNIGLRKVSLEKVEGTPRLFVNGDPVLVMGGEYMSEDLILPRLSEERTRALLETAKKANFNSIFIHGSGYYPENYFFNACDELGLMVFTELPIEDADGADSAEMCEALKTEFLDNLTRVDHHPSFCVVIGNERVARLFKDKNEADEFAEAFCDFEGMNVFDVGGECNEHFVRVAHTSLPTYRSVKKFAQPKHRNLGSPFFETHGADSETVGEMLSSALENYPYAGSMDELSYVMGLCSAELSMREVEDARIRKERPFGILMSRMNESWPSLSPSGVDYYGGKKPLHYYERDFFAPVKVSATANGTRIKFVVSNDMRQDYVGVFSYQIMNNKNLPVFRDSFPIRARASSNLEVHNVDIGSVISGHENEYYLLFSVHDKCNDVSKGLLLFTNTKRFKFNESKCEISILGNGMEYVATVSSDSFVKGVELSFGDEEVFVDKNYFDITGKAPVRVRLTTKRMTTIEKLNRVVKVRTVYDLGKES